MNTLIFWQVSAEAELTAHGPWLGDIGVESHNHFRTCCGTKADLLPRALTGLSPCRTQDQEDCFWTAAGRSCSQVYDYFRISGIQTWVLLSGLCTSKTSQATAQRVKTITRLLQNVLGSSFKVLTSEAPRIWPRGVTELGQGPFECPQPRPKLMSLLSEAYVGMIFPRSFGMQC